MIDIHSHIIPGVDDGARSFEDSVKIVKYLSAFGVTDVVATPHYVAETKYSYPREVHLKKLDELKAKLSEAEVDVRVWLGNEIYINDKIDNLVRDGVLSPLADSKYLLVELPLDEEYPNYAGYLHQLILFGYKVVLAHPERYAIFQENYNLAVELYELGVYFQCNYGSVVGKYGIKAEQLVRRFAKDKMIFAFASDIHSVWHKDYIKMAMRKLKRYYNDRELVQLTTVNPGQILTSS